MHKYITFTIIFPILIWGATSVIRQWRAEVYFNRAQSLNHSMNSTNSMNPNHSITQLPNYLTKAIALDPSNAEYHFHLAEAYTRMMRKSWKKGNWKLEHGKWVFGPGQKTLDYALNALDSYKRALSLQPTDSNYHLSLAWHYGTLAQLSTVSGQSSVVSGQDSRTLRPNDATTPKRSALCALPYASLARSHFDAAISLAPTSSYAHRLYGLWAFNQLTAISSQLSAGKTINKSRITNNASLLSAPCFLLLPVALRHYCRAIELEPSLASEFYEQLYKITQDVDELKKFVANDATSHYQFGSFLKNKGLKEEGKRRFW